MWCQHAKQFDIDNFENEGVIQRRRWTRRNYVAVVILSIWSLFVTTGLILCLKSWPSALLHTSSAAMFSPHHVPRQSDLFLTEDESVAVKSTRAEMELAEVENGLQIRDPEDGYLRKYGVMGLRLLGLSNGAVGIWSIASDCKDYSTNEAGEVGFKCIYGAISTAIAGCVTIQGAYSMSGSIKDIVTIYLGWKRGELSWEPIERDFSAQLGAEVRHIGFWNNNTPKDPTKRDDEAAMPHPVFGVLLNGRELHFTQLSQRDDNSTVIRIGNGIGLPTENNKRRLQARNELGPYEYNAQYFDHGGLDFVASTGLDPISPDIPFGDLAPDNYAWVFEKVDCFLSKYFYGDDILAGIALIGSIGNVLDKYGAIDFQVETSADGMTLVAGAIAPFSGNTPSIINTLHPVGDNPISECIAV